MRNIQFKLFIGLSIFVGLLICCTANAKTRVVTPSNPVVSESLKPIIKEYRDGNYTQSMIDLEQLIKKEPNNAYANYYLALTYTQLGKAKEAQQYYQKVIDLNSNMSLRYYSQKALACIGNANASECTGVKSTNEFVAKKDSNEEEDDDITKFIKSGKMIHPAAYDAITKERMERKLQQDEYQRKHQEQENNLSQLNIPTKEEIASAYDVLSRAGLNTYDSSLNDFDLAYLKNDDLYLQMLISNQLMQQDIFNNGI